MSAGYVVIGVDADGVTPECAPQPNVDAAADRLAAAAQQEADRWPDLGLVYMVVTEAEAREVVP